MGDERKIFFVHGWGTDNSVWRGVEREFANAALIGLPSHSEGFGKWDSPTLTPGVREAAKATDGAGEAVFVGWSLGGKVLIKAIAEGALRCKGLMLVSATPCFTSRDEFSYGQSPALVRRMLMDMSTDASGTLKRFYKLNFTEEEAVEESVKDFLDVYERGEPRFDYDGVANALRALKDADLREELGRVKVPTLIVHGGLDLVTPVEASTYMRERIAGAIQIVLDGAGHAPFITQRDVFVKILKDFVAGL